MREGDERSRQRSSLPAILALTFLASIGTGILWGGLSFIAKHSFGYTEQQTLLLFVVVSIAYVGSALASGPITRALSTGQIPWAGLPVRLSPRGFLVGVLLAQACAAVMPLLFHGEWMLWFVACVTSVLAAMLWPVVESYLTAGRHGAAMRSAMGWWNITWTGAVAVALIGMAPLLSEGRALWAIIALAPCSLLAIPLLAFFTPSPGEHDEEQWKASVSLEYPLLLRSARVLLPVSYLLIGAISPLMPYLLEQLDVRTIAETPMTATWMVARVAAIAIMWRMRFWHGRWGALALGGFSMTLGFIMIVTAPNVLVLISGLAILGAGQGIVYYAALYYAMSVGRAAVEAGGVHEALIGLGYAAGPTAAIAGLRLSAAAPAISAAAGITGIVSAALFVLAMPAITPYKRARQQRVMRRVV